VPTGRCGARGAPAGSCRRERGCAPLRQRRAAPCQTRGPAARPQTGSPVQREEGAVRRRAARERAGRERGAQREGGPVPAPSQTGSQPALLRTGCSPPPARRSCRRRLHKGERRARGQRAARASSAKRALRASAQHGAATAQKRQRRSTHARHRAESRAARRVQRRRQGGCAPKPKPAIQRMRQACERLRLLALKARTAQSRRRLGHSPGEGACCDFGRDHPVEDRRSRGAYDHRPTHRGGHLSLMRPWPWPQPPARVLVTS
jgi:hypothetical protein